MGCSEGAGKQRGVCGEVGGVRGVGCAAGDGEWDEGKRTYFALTGSAGREVRRGGCGAGVGCGEGGCEGSDEVGYARRM